MQTDTKPLLLDKYFLDLQFSNKLHTSNGNEFQSFFENLMELSFDNFEKVRPYGAEGDRGNDGFRRGEGIYYQVYSPFNPESKDREAANKFGRDFTKTQSHWMSIEPIQEYVFVLNDKERGTSIILEQRRKDLEDSNPGIKFTILRTNRLRRMFKDLSKTSLLELGFQIDSLKVNELAGSILSIASTEIDRSNSYKAKELLSSLEIAIQAIDNPEVRLQYQIANSKCLRNLEQPETALVHLESIVSEFPSAYELFIALSEVCYQLDDLKKSNTYLERAREISPDGFEIKIQSFLQRINSETGIEQHELKSTIIPNNDRIASVFCRLSGIARFSRGDLDSAEIWLKESIERNPNRFDSRRLLLEVEAQKTKSMDSESFSKREAAESMNQKIDSLIVEFGGLDTLDPRQKVHISRLRLEIAVFSGNRRGGGELIEKCVQSCLTCKYDTNIDLSLQICLHNGQLSQEALELVTDYLVKQKLPISFDLSKILIARFSDNGTLEEEGKKFFNKVNQSAALELIDHYILKDLEYILPILKKDQYFALSLIDSIKEYSDFSENLISILDSEKQLQERIRIQLLCKSGQLKKAFEISKNIDLKIISPQEIYDFLAFMREFNAWDIEIELILRLVDIEPESNSINIRLNLFDAYIRAKRFPEAINLGKKLIEFSISELGGFSNWEVTFRNTLIACIERSVVEENALHIALDLVKHRKLETSDFTINARIIPDIYIRLGMYKEAFEAIVVGIEKVGQIPPTEYAAIYFNFITRLGKEFLLSDYEITELRGNDFFHLKEKDQWYRLGEKVILGSYSILPNTPRYVQLIGLKKGDKVDLSSTLNPTSNFFTIDEIASVEVFVFNHVVKTAKILADQDILPGVTLFEIPEIDGELDINSFSDLLRKVTGESKEFFELYAQAPVPFAALSMIQGGFVRGVSKINAEQKGFINFCKGDQREFRKQIDLAKITLSNNDQAVLDSTSAVFLAEFGLITEILTKMPNLKIPSSVLDLLYSILKTFSEHSTSDGSLSVTEDRVSFKEVNESDISSITSNIRNAIQSIESNIGRIVLISDTHKSEKFSENKIEACYVDASIFARKNNCPVITDDFNYLKMSELEHGYEEHRYFSSLALVLALRELNEISISEFVRYFQFCASYRFRFLSVNANLIETAILGGGLIKEINIRNLEKLNLPLLFSEEYGAETKGCETVIADFVTRILIDQSIMDNTCEAILVQFISLLPNKFSNNSALEVMRENCLDRANDILDNAPYIFNREFIMHRQNLLSKAARLFRYRI